MIVDSFITIEFEEVVGQQCLSCRDAGFGVGDGRIVDGFGANVYLGVISLTMKVEIEFADDVTKWEKGGFGAMNLVESRLEGGDVVGLEVGGK